MGSPYAGVDDFPDDIELPDDGDIDAAAAFNVPYEGLANRTINLRNRLNAEIATRSALSKRVDRALALNFPAAVVSSLVVTHVKYLPSSRKWAAISSAHNDRFLSTLDPFVWPNPISTTEIDGGALWAQPAWDFAEDTTGALVVVATGIDRYWTRTAGGVWTRRSTIIGDDFDAPAIVYDDVHSLWCVVVCAQPGGNAELVTSPDGVTWTSRTPPTGLPTGAPFTLGYHAGVIVMRCATGTNLYTSRSTDGGITWSAAVVTALGITVNDGGGALSVRRSSPIWTGTEWLISVVDDAAPATRIYASPTGATWTLRCSLSTFAVQYFACVAGVLCGVGPTAHQIVASEDGGATWFYGTRAIAGTLTGIAASPVQFLIVENGYLYPGLAIGDGLGSVV